MDESFWIHLRYAIHWGWKLLAIAALFVLFLLTLLIIYEHKVRRDSLSLYPPPGRMIKITGHEIHLHCMGSGTPVVVFESDIDPFGSLSWEAVQPAVGGFTRACSYDRAGILWSEPGPLPRDGAAVAGELRAVLEAAGERGPYVLAGHAFGGAYARIFAGENIRSVCGLVLIDSSHPDQLERLADAGLKKQIPPAGLRPLISLISNLGLPARFTGPRYSLPNDVYTMEQAFMPGSSLAWFDESSAAPATLAQAARFQDLGGIPLILLASARPPSAGQGGELLGEAWIALQYDLVALSRNSEVRLFADAGHYLQFEKPEAVVDAIRDVVIRCVQPQPEG